MSAFDSAVVAAREMMHDMTQQDLRTLGPCPPDLKEATVQVPLSDGTTQRTILVWPTNTSASIKKLPLIVFFHGGGWAVGGPEFSLSPARGFANLLGAIVASPSYKYTPEDPFPAPMQSGWDAAAWLAHPENLHNAALKDEQVEFDPSLGLFVGGVSAGANLAAVIAGISAATAANKGSKLAQGLSELTQPIKGVFLSVPLVVHEDMVLPAEYASIWTSRVEHADAPILNANQLVVVHERLKADYHSPWFSPLNLDLATLVGHHAPKVYVQAGQLDVLRDDAVVYARALGDKAVAETRLDVVQDVDHAGWCSLPVPACHSEEMRTKSLDGMAWLMGTEWDKSKALPY